MFWDYGLQISPHEFVQEVSVSSKKRFHVGQQNEAVEFLSWLLNELHRVRDC
jgi:U4/U6.U5 tri-snRNP-associated protein 2